MFIVYPSAIYFIMLQGRRWVFYIPLMGPYTRKPLKKDERTTNTVIIVILTPPSADCSNFFLSSNRGNPIVFCRILIYRNLRRSIIRGKIKAVVYFFAYVPYFILFFLCSQTREKSGPCWLLKFKWMETQRIRGPFLVDSSTDCTSMNSASVCLRYMVYKL